LRDQRSNKRNDDDCEKRANEGRGKGGGQCLPRPALLRHGVAVECGRDRPWLSRYVEEHRGDGAAKQGPPVDTRQHDDRRCRRHAERQRQQNGNPVGAAKTGQHANDHAKDDAQHHQCDIVGLAGDGKAVEQTGQIFQHQ
jgi:hypothetical protein